MHNSLIQLEDGTLVEISITEEGQQISGGFAHKVRSGFSKIKPVLLNICKPISELWAEMDQQVMMEQAEVEIGLSFEGEGNLYVTKSKLGANLSVKLVFKPLDHK